MAKTKEISLDFRRRIANAHKAGEYYTKISECFQVSRSGVRDMIKKFNEIHTIQNKIGRGRKWKFKNFKDSGKKTSERPEPFTITGMNCEVEDQENTTAERRHLQAWLKYAKDNLEEDCILEACHLVRWDENSSLAI